MTVAEPGASSNVIVRAARTRSLRAALCLLAGLPAWSAVGCAPATTGHARSPVGVGEPPAAPSSQRTLSPAEIAERSLPAVVTIHSGDWLGTGFVVRPDGWIATNLHVLMGAPDARVVLRDGRELDVAEVIASSVEHDLAVIRVNAQGLPALALGDSAAMRPGDPVVAIGNPLGLEDTVSGGLLSARRKAEHGFEFLQISAPIAHGSSGGPIFNERGEVIGVATALAAQGQNITFGVPSSYLMALIERPAPAPLADVVGRISRERAAAVAGPQVIRQIPHHPLSLLDGCDDDAIRFIAETIEGAINVGAPLYNQGDHAGCYHIYDGAASDIGRQLRHACAGPTRALVAAQMRAATAHGATLQAWAMRDGFDGLLDVISRRTSGKK